MELKRKQPMGIELVRRGLVTEADITRALEYQKQNSEKKIGDILNVLGLCDPYVLIQTMAEILGEKGILLKMPDVKLNVSQYISIDVAKATKAIPFEENAGKVKVCFADISNKKAVETVRLLLLNKGLIMEKYITFESNIIKILNQLEGEVTEDITVSRDITGLIDNIIKTAIDKRASDIHIEPLEDEIRIRYRIDGELVTVGSISKDKQTQIIGRLKVISNMYQEKQSSQDGRILLYSNYNIRVSSQKNVCGEKFVLRLLKKNDNIKQIFELGFPGDEVLVSKSFNKRNSVTIIAAPTGEGKTTTLYSIIDFLNKPEINITTIEDPVEIRIPGLNQIEIEEKNSFSDSLRTVLRQDPDVILVGEIRDKETAEIAMQSGQTGHYVLSTIHTIDSIEVITRLRKIGISNYDIASTLATAVSQRLIRKVCPKCSCPRDFTQEEKDIIMSIGKKNNVEFDLKGKKTYDVKGCKYCNQSGYYERIGIFEILSITEELKELIVDNQSSIVIRNKAKEQGFQPLVIDGINKVLNGVTTLQEINKKLIIF